MSKFHDKVQKLRAEIAQTQEELEWLADAALPKSDLKAAIAASVASNLGDEGTAGLLLQMAAADAGARGEAASQLLRVRASTRPEPHAPGVSSVDLDLAPLLALVLGKEAIIVALHQRVDALSYTAGPPAAERPAKRAKLRAELRRLETAEEAAIVAAEDAGEYIARRADADPAVILEYIEAPEEVDAEEFDEVDADAA